MREVRCGQSVENLGYIRTYVELSRWELAAGAVRREFIGFSDRGVWLWTEIT